MSNADDAPIFDAEAFRLTAQERELTARARELGQTRFAARAGIFDREARFPTENYADLREAGLLGVCVPAAYGGLGADYRAYALTAAEIGRYCGATALTFNMHVCSCLWTGPLADTLDMTDAERAAHEQRRAKHYARIVDDGAVYAQPFSEGGSAAAGAVPFATTAVREGAGWRLNGRKIFASLAGHADYYGILCTEADAAGQLARRNTLYVAVPASAPGLRVEGDWDPLGMRGTVSRTLVLEDVVVGAEEALMPAGFYYQGAVRWPHMFLTLTPTYLGIAQAAYDFTVRYLRGEVPGQKGDKRRDNAVKQHNVAQMRLMLEQTKCLWFQVVSEARVDPGREMMLRAWAAQYSVMENANEMTQLAIRTCGGQSMLKSLPLERLYRDSRCGSLMLPWNADICLERIGHDALYLPGEND
ncbi:MAG: acyl-CoA dehydrogenase family protein [Gammaproteobacteria bacterium]|nr:acyl-CoA dehydrogenase family protein [Gammaproteobacteria bacterium]MCP5198629.1 acyl-CoA dehydrogenase family protein [Gammaproteobacteria bacterium]